MYSRSQHGNPSYPMNDYRGYPQGGYGQPQYGAPPPQYGGYPQHYDDQSRGGHKKGGHPQVQQPGYGHQPYPMVHQPPQARPADYLILAIIVAICCNPVCGLIAVILSVMSKGDSDKGDYEGGRSKGRVSLGLSITGIILTVLIVIAVLVWWFVFAAAVINKALNIG